MAEVTAQAVGGLRDRTGLPMMECKSALIEAGGDEEKAIELMRKRGLQAASKRAGRETTEGRIASFVGPKCGTLVELRCESAPVASNDEFRGLASDLAETLAGAAGVSDPEALLRLKDKAGQPLQERFDTTLNRMRENIVLARLLRWEGVTGSYVHHDGKQAALIEVDRVPSRDGLLKELCMHIVSARPMALKPDELDAALVAKEREILTEQARASGKPEAVIEKMVEGRMRSFYAERVLLEQPFALDASKTVGVVAKEAGVAVGRFVRWDLGVDG